MQSLTCAVLASHGMLCHWQTAPTPRRQSERDTLFVTRAYYKLVLHPLMLGFMIAFWATPAMSQGHLLFALMTTVYIGIAVKFLEERDLITAHGETYREDQRKVPVLLPLPKRYSRQIRRCRCQY